MITNESNILVSFPLWHKIHFPFFISNRISRLNCHCCPGFFFFFFWVFLSWDQKQNSICIKKKLLYKKYPIILLLLQSLSSELMSFYDAFLNVVNTYSLIPLIFHPFLQHCLQCCGSASPVCSVPMGKTWSLQAMLPSHKSLSFGITSWSDGQRECVKRSCIYHFSCPLPVGPQLGVGLHAHLPAPCWDVFPAWACACSVHAVTPSVSSHTHLPCCVWKSRLPCSHLPPLALTTFLFLLYNGLWALGGSGML